MSDEKDKEIKKEKEEPQVGVSKEGDTPKTKRFNFDFIKSNSHRVIHVDGVWGGISPNYNIHISVVSERPPIPNRIVQELTENGLTEVKSEREIRDALVREVEATLIMDLPTAHAFLQWLSNKVKELDALYEANFSQGSDTE